MPMAAWTLLSNSFPGEVLPLCVALALEGDELIVFNKWSEDRSDGKHAGYWAFDLTAKQWRQKEFRPPESVVDLQGSALKCGEDVIVYPGGYSKFPVTRRCNLRTSTVLEQRGQEAAEDARVHGHSGHSAVLWQDRLVVFGGYTGGVPDVNETWSFDLRASRWRPRRLIFSSLRHLGTGPDVAAVEAAELHRHRARETILAFCCDVSPRDAHPGWYGQNRSLVYGV